MSFEPVDSLRKTDAGHQILYFWLLKQFYIFVKKLPIIIISKVGHHGLFRFIDRLSNVVYVSQCLGILLVYIVKFVG
jgi:hypothetical protein